MATSSSYSVTLEPQEGGGFTALVPALPEVVTEGETEQDALANAKTIRAILEYRQEQGVLEQGDASKRHLTPPPRIHRDRHQRALRDRLRKLRPPPHLERRLADLHDALRQPL